MSKSGLFAVKASHLGKSARSRARLIDAALAVFARQGLEAASINEIAREADMANGTFYLHFKDKDELTSVVALSVADEIVRQLDAAMADIDDAAERVSLARASSSISLLKAPTGAGPLPGPSGCSRDCELKSGDTCARTSNVALPMVRFP